MAIKVRNSSEKVTGGFSLMTGATTASVLAINPTVEQLKSVLGFEEPREPAAYLGTDNNGNRNVRLDIWVQPTGTEIKQKFSLFVSDAEVVTQDGNKKQYTNAHGQFGYFPSAEVPENFAKFFSAEGLRTAYQGEEKLVNFIQALANLKMGKAGDDVTLNYDQLFEGNLSEIQDVLTQVNAEGNTVGLMFGVRTVPQEDGTTKQYQDVYTKAFFRPTDDLNQKFTEQLNDPYGAWDRDYQNSTEFQTYSPTTVNTTEGAVAAGGIDEGDTDDLPW